MEKDLPDKLAKEITPEVIELLGDSTCNNIDEMVQSNCPEDKILDLIHRKVEKLDEEVETPFYNDILQEVRKTSKYQLGMNQLMKNISRELGVRMARKRGLELVGLQGYALMDDIEVRKSIIRARDVAQMSKALVVKDFIQKVYGVSLAIL